MIEHQEALREEKRKKQSYYAKMKEAQAAKWDYDYVDYDGMKSKKDDEEYYMRGRTKRVGRDDQIKKKFRHQKEVRAEEKGAIYALSALAGVVILIGLCQCCYKRAKENASARAGYGGVELRI